VAKAKGKRLGGARIRRSDGQRVTVSAEARRRGSDRVSAKARERAADLLPSIAEIQAAGCTSMRGIAAALNDRMIPTARGNGRWTAVQVGRILQTAKRPTGLPR
jgi:hypothetical protein